MPGASGNILSGINDHGQMSGVHNSGWNAYIAAIATTLQAVTAGSGIQLQIQGPVGGHWQVQESADLAAWSALGPVVTNTASPTVVSVPGPLSAQAFFRLMSAPGT